MELLGGKHTASVRRKADKHYHGLFLISGEIDDSFDSCLNLWTTTVLSLCRPLHLDRIGPGMFVLSVWNDSKAGQVQSDHGTRHPRKIQRVD